MDTSRRAADGGLAGLRTEAGGSWRVGPRRERGEHPLFLSHPIKQDLLSKTVVL